MLVHDLRDGGKEFQRRRAAGAKDLSPHDLFIFLIGGRLFQEQNVGYGNINIAVLNQTKACRSARESCKQYAHSWAASEVL